MAYKITIDGEGVSVAKEVEAGIATQIIALVLSGSPSPGNASVVSSSSAPALSPIVQPQTQTSRKTTRKRATSPGVVKNLVLRPEGVQSFRDFVDEKKPGNNLHRNLVAVYWLKHVASVSEPISADHVNTCYLDASWKRPADLANSLQQAGSKGWLDTSSMTDIKMTNLGEDEVRFTLPPRQDK